MGAKQIKNKLAYIHENQRFAEQGKDFRQFIKKGINGFRATSNTKLSTLNISVPEALMQKIEKDKMTREYKASLLDLTGRRSKGSVRHSPLSK